MGVYRQPKDMIAEVCRACFTDVPPFYNLFDCAWEPGLTLSQMYSFVSGFPLEENDQWPQGLCYTCMIALTDSYERQIQFYRDNR